MSESYPQIPSLEQENPSSWLKSCNIRQLSLITNAPHPLRVWYQLSSFRHVRNGISSKFNVVQNRIEFQQTFDFIQIFFLVFSEITYTIQFQSGSAKKNDQWEISILHTNGRAPGIPGSPESPQKSLEGLFSEKTFSGKTLFLKSRRKITFWDARAKNL